MVDVIIPPNYEQKISILETFVNLCIYNACGNH